MQVRFADVNFRSRSPSPSPGSGSPRAPRKQIKTPIRSIHILPTQSGNGKVSDEDVASTGEMKNEFNEEKRDNSRESIWDNLFAALDEDEDGILSDEELWSFIKSINCPILQKMSREDFEEEVYSRCMDEERGLFQDKFIREDFITWMEEYSMKIFFDEADNDEDGIVTFEEIITACTMRGLNIGYSEILAIKMLFDSDNTLLSPKDIVEKVKQCKLTPAMANMPDNEGGAVHRALGKLDKEVFKGKDSKFFMNAFKFMESSTKRTPSKHWKGFINFQRYVQGKMAMVSPDHLVKDILPGNFIPTELVRFSDLPALNPRYAEVNGMRWMSSESAGQSGCLLFPESFSGKIPVQYATNELLSYFKVTIAESNDNPIALTLRHAIQDFTYSDNYLEDYCTLPKEKGGAGGAGCERHQFSHLDCPLKEDSGIFVFLKFVDEKETCVHISAFRIPVRHTLYIPSGVIHTNDYLRGTWRTMLSNAGPPIDHVHLQKGSTDASEKFHFTFN